MIVQTTEPLLKRMLQIHSGSSFFIEPTCDYKILTSFFYGIEFSFSVPETRSVGKYAEAVFNRHSSRGWTNLVMTEICGWVEAPPEDKKLVVYDSLFEFFANYLRSTTSIEYSTLDDLKTACEYANTVQSLYMESTSFFSGRSEGWVLARYKRVQVGLRTMEQIL